MKKLIQYTVGIPSRYTTFTVLLATLVASTASADLQPRDLDQDPTTTEAWYDDQQQITFLANANLALTEKFGIGASVAASSARRTIARELVAGDDGIDEKGLMEHRTMGNWIAAMNDAGYMGYNQWRLPTLEWQFLPEPPYEIYSNHELRQLNGQFEDLFSTDKFINVSRDNYLTGSTAHGGYPAYYDFETDSGYITPLHLSTTERFAAWPVHDGDIGLAIPIADCVDSDGDGWGWDGSQSCRLARSPGYDPLCIDSDGDGWGWNGTASCTVARDYMPAPIDDCIDSDGDGWGWDGHRSCRTDQSTDNTTIRYYWKNTGETINGVVSLRWNAEDLSDKTLACRNTDNLAALISYQFNADGTGVHSYFSGGRAYETYSLREDRFNWTISDAGVVTSESALSGGGLSLFSLPALERHDGYWFLFPENDNSVNRYQDCSLEDGSVLRATRNTQALGDCIDSDGDGWGWDGTASCKIP